VNLLAHAGEDGVHLPTTVAASSSVASMLITINAHRDVELDAVNVIAIKGAFNDDATLDAMQHDLPGAFLDAYFGAELTGESFEHCCVTNDHSSVEDQCSFGILGLADVVMANVAKAIRVVHHLDHRCFTANATTYYFNY